MFMRKIFTIICSIVAFATAYAQEQTSGVPFNGLVLDGAGNGISRMRVEVKGTEKRTLTDKQGRFGLTD